MAQEPQESLFADFSPISIDQWKEKILKDLKGKDWNSLTWHTGEGISLQPFYRQEDLKRSEFGRDSLPGEFPFRRGNTFNASNDGWQLVQQIPISAGDQIPAMIQEAQNNEVHAFQLSGNAEIDQLEELFEKIDFDQTALHLSFPNVPALLSLDLYTVLNQKGIRADQLTGTLLNDPISQAAAKGRISFKADFAMIEAGVMNYKASPWFRGIGLDFSYVHEQGGSIIQELAFGLSTLVDYLDLHGRTVSEVSLEDLLQNLSFTFAVGNNFFLELAKFRAFRMLFAQVLKAYGIEDPKLASPFVIGKTGNFNLNIYDGYNNLLRTTTAAISAILGGVQAMVVQPFDKLTEGPNPMSARLARNIQHLLKHESHLDEVLDPAGGSYYVEKATDELGQAAWKLFQNIEAQGGFTAMIKEGSIQLMLEEAKLQREEALSKLKEKVIGLNVSPNTQESLEQEYVEDGRLANEFEKIRLQVDAMGRQREKRLSTFLLLFGEARMRNARAQFARNLLGSGGFAIAENTKPADLMASIKEAIDSKAEVLVLCAGNEDYEREAKGICDQIKASPYQPIMIQAGKTEGWKDCGIEDVIFAGMDSLDFLDKLVRGVS